MKRLIIWLPLVVFVAFVITVAIGLRSGKDETIRSQMVGKPVPSFALSAGVGRGLIGGYGSPAVRAFFGLTWVPLSGWTRKDEPTPTPAAKPQEEPAPEPTPSSVRASPTFRP